LHIDPKTTIAGIPALEARKLVSNIPYEANGFSVQCLSRRFGITQKLAQLRILAFETEGYFEKIIDDGKKSRWQLTMKSASLAQASAAKKVKRDTADKHYQAFFERISEINVNDAYLYQVAKVVLFGSYLTGNNSVSDIDLFVWINRKPQFEAEFTSIREQRTKEMHSQGRHFKDYVEELAWPELDVRKYLKNGSRVISIQPFNEGYERFEHKIVFDITESTESTA